MTKNVAENLRCVLKSQKSAKCICSQSLALDKHKKFVDGWMYRYQTSFIKASRGVNLEIIKQHTAWAPWSCVWGRQVWNYDILRLLFPSPAAESAACCVDLAALYECDWSTAGLEYAEDMVCPFDLLCAYDSHSPTARPYTNWLALNQSIKQWG